MPSPNLAPRLVSLLTLSSCLALPAARAAVVWDESSDGDLSGDRNSPTSISLAVGENELVATSSSGDLEYITFGIPTGFQWESLVVQTYSGSDGRAFIGLQPGTAFTEDPNAADPGNLLGYAHFGTSEGNVGDDILPTMGTAIGSQGFTPPLGAGDYTVWLQQLGASTTYQLQIVVAAVPEPAAMASAVGLTLGSIGILRRRLSRIHAVRREVMAPQILGQGAK